MEKNKFLIIVGNVGEQLTFIGPFDTPHEANEWAENAHFVSSWVCVPLYSKEEAL